MQATHRRKHRQATLGNNFTSASSINLCKTNAEDVRLIVWSTSSLEKAKIILSSSKAGCVTSLDHAVLDHTSKCRLRKTRLTRMVSHFCTTKCAHIVQCSSTIHKAHVRRGTRYTTKLHHQMALLRKI